MNNWFKQLLKGQDNNTLDLACNNIGYEGAKALAEGLKDTNITTLNLRNNRCVQKILYDIDKKIKLYQEIDNKLSTPFYQDSIIGGLIRDEKLDKLELYIKNLKDSDDVKPLVKQYISAIADITSNDLTQSRYIRLFKNYHKKCTHKDAKDSLDHMQRKCGKFIGINLKCSLEEKIAILLQCEKAGLSEVVEELLSNRDIFYLPKTENTKTPKLHPFAVVLMNRYNLLPESKEWRGYTDKMIKEMEDEYINFETSLRTLISNKQLDFEEITKILPDDPNLSRIPDYSSASVEDTTESVYPDIAISGNTGDEMNYPH